MCTCGDIQLIVDAQTMVIDTHWMDWYQNLADFEMELGTGISELAVQWGNCCNLKYNTMIDLPTGFMNTFDANGNVTGSTVTTTPVPSVGVAAHSNAWNGLLAQSSHSAWLAAYNDWQDQQQLLAVAEALAYLGAMAIFIGHYNDFLDCANTEQGNLKAIRANISASADTARTGLDSHMANTGAAPYTWTDYKMENDAVCNLSDDLLAYQATGMFGYEMIQKDHIQNMGTHLAQLCTNARDISNDMKTCLQFLDDAHVGGGIWDMYEQCLMTGTGPGPSFADIMCDAAGVGQQISNTLQTCGELITDCYTTGGFFTDTIKPALQMLIDNMVAATGTLNDLQDLTDTAQQCITDIKANFTAVYEAQEMPGGATDKLMGIACDLFESPNGVNILSDCNDMMQTCIVENKDILDRYLGTLAGNGNSSGEYCLGRAIIDQACGLVNDLQTAVTFLKDHSVNCLADYEANYNAKEGVLAVTLLNLACDMAICITAAHTWFTNHSDQLEACWAQGYEVGEKNLAFDILAEADALVTQHSDVFDCLKACSDEAKMCYTNFYLVEEKATIAEIHDNAQQLADCIVDAHTWLCDQADKHRDRYCDFWVPKENAYVCAVLDKAIELACESKDCLADWCIQQDDKWDWWMNCFQDPEKQTIPKLITAAIDACDKNLDSYQKACDRSDELWDKYMDEWCPCDIIDLNKHCDIWNKVNMLEEICDANACLRTTAEILKECYTDLMLTCEKDYLDFVCNMAYDPKYCDSNTRAVAHTRKNYESQLDLLDQSMPPWCRAAFEDRKIDIKNDQIIAEALSIQVADRWEWLRNVHEDDRKHNYLQDIIRNFGEQWISNSHEMYRSVQQGNDMLLRHVHDRIVRGRLYLDSSFGHLDRTLTALDQTIGNGIQAVNQSHFWPQWYNDGRNAYLQQSNNYLNLADDVIRLGHDTYQMASRDKTTAANLAENAVQAGLAAVDRGHQVKQHALDAASRADQVIQGSVSEGIQTINMGHDLHNMAKASQDSAANTAYQSTQQGLDTVDRGHRVKQMAMDAATSQWQGAHAGIQDGLTSIDLGHFWATHAQNTTEAKINAYHEAWRNTVSHLQHGQRYLSIAAQWGDVANASLRSEIELGNIGLSNALSWFNTAQSKLEAALTAQQSNVGHAVDLLQQGYGRMDSVLGHKNDMQGMIRQSTDGMINMAAEGNRFIYAAADSTVRGAELKKNAITCACDLAMTYYSTMSNQEINLGSAIMGSSYNAAQNALGQINGLANGLSGSIQQIIGPPPTQGLGFNYGTLGNINNGGIVQSGPL